MISKTYPRVRLGKFFDKFDTVLLNNSNTTTIDQFNEEGRGDGSGGGLDNRDSSGYKVIEQLISYNPDNKQKSLRKLYE